ncbi:MAG: glycogen synthase [Oscillospiraceae bacterium]|jgi:starch synthase|nr:glycogen synthase [Oscillospiraceae bacterium]
MKIAMVASEAAPFVKTGGLGDVMQALPQELSKAKGNEVCLFLPYYKRVKQNAAIVVEAVGSFSIEHSWPESYVGIFRLKSRRKKLQVYFIDNDYYFGARNTIYGDFDDGERFAFFSKAVLAALYYIDFKPDILHAHDWQSAMVPVYMRALYGTWCPNTKAVFTIHNVEYQGWAESSFFGSVLRLPDSFRDAMTFDGAINVMKGAIEISDIVTTVSKTYAEELRYPYYAHRLDGVLRSNWLWGITNGIDTSVYNPATDPALACPFDDMAGKQKNKRALQEEMGLDTASDAPILAMVTRLVGHKGIDLLCHIGKRLMERNVQMVIIGTGERQYEYALSALAREYPGRFAVRLCFDSAVAARVYAGADMYLMPSKSEPCGLSQLIAMRYGAIPIVAATGGLRDTVPAYNPESKEGRGFTFQSYNADDFLGAIDRAVGLYYGDRAQWDALAYKDMCSDFSWKLPAEEYMQLYQEVLSK